MNIAFTRSLIERRDSGVFYTPQEVANTIAGWAIRSKSDSVFEPGFGGCGFLEASSNRMRRLGAKQPFENIFGCDIDNHAFQALNSLKMPTEYSKHFIKRDFLKLQPEDFSMSKKFNVIIGNPPYVSLQAMSAQQRDTAQYSSENNKICNLGKRASLWAHFIVHAQLFLKKGGRVGWVLPASYLYTEYAKPLRRYFNENFKTVFEITLEERLFSSEGASERTVLVLADGYKKANRANQHRSAHAKDSKELQEVVEGINNNNFGSKYIGKSESQKAAEKLTSLSAKYHSCQLSEYADIKIGIVTGANKFFIKSSSDWKLEGVRKNSTYPIVSKFRQISGIEIKSSDLKMNIANEEPCLLIKAGTKNILSKRVKRYLLSFPNEEIESNATFRKRSIWYAPDDNRVPCAFLSYMCHHGPRLALNEAETTSTNTIHRVYFDKEISLTRKRLVCISLLTTPSQLSAEIVGRSYGSGVLKLEPSEAKNIEIFESDNLSSNSVRAVYKKIDRLLREKKMETAEHEANKFIFGDDFDAQVFKALTNSLEKLREIRQEPRKIK